MNLAALDPKFVEGQFDDVMAVDTVDFSGFSSPHSSIPQSSSDSISYFCLSLQP